MSKPISFLLIALSALLLMSSCVPTSAPNATNPERDKLIAQLRQRLDTVAEHQRSQYPQPFEVQANDDVSLLRGLTQHEIQVALGDPQICAAGKLVAPCTQAGDWFYSFYYLPAGYVGGGAELLLRFDDQGVCRSAQWLWTQ